MIMFDNEQREMFPWEANENHRLLLETIDILQVGIKKLTFQKDVVEINNTIIPKPITICVMTNVRHFCCDDETGEVITYCVNQETGELASVPLPLAAPPSPRPVPAKTIPFPKGYMSETKKFQNLKANIIEGSNVFSPRLLLIPTVAVCPAVVIALLMILELFLHVRCHQKNKSLNDPKLYYRSPFHIITSIFCRVCCECDAMSKIGQLQDQRRCRYEYLKGMAM